MKYLESFSMYRENCDRCHNPTNGKTTMSIFNEDVICMDCKEKESDEPDYMLAKDKELEEIKKGNLNYKGIWSK